MNDLRSRIDALASQFAANIRSAIQESLVDNLTGALMNGAATRRPIASVASVASDKPRAGKGGRLARRSPEDIERVANEIIALVASKGPMRAEAIREALSIDKKEWMKPIGAALASKRIKKSGEKRATEYSAGAPAAKAKPVAKAKKAKPAAKKKTKAVAKAAPKKIAKTAPKKGAKSAKKQAPTKKAAPPPPPPDSEPDAEVAE